MHKKVMIVDDNEVDLYIAQRVIEKYSFAEEVILMDSAMEALEYLTANAGNPEMIPDLVFLDVNMPEMNGFEFLDAYTKLPENIKESCIIMMLTTSVHEEDKERADKNPYVRNYLNKPLDEDKLKALG
jgi:CheY-like chemotaxis protein